MITTCASIHYFWGLCAYASTLLCDCNLYGYAIDKLLLFHLPTSNHGRWIMTVKNPAVSTYV